MKALIDTVIQPRSVTFSSSFEISERPFEIVVPLGKKFQRDLEKASLIGHRLVHELSSVKDVSKILISKYEVETILTRLCDQSLERALIEAMTKALGAAAGIEPEFVVVTRNAGEEEGPTVPIDPPTAE